MSVSEPRRYGTIGYEHHIIIKPDRLSEVGGFMERIPGHAVVLRRGSTYDTSDPEEIRAIESDPWFAGGKIWREKSVEELQVEKRAVLEDLAKELGVELSPKR